MELRTLHARTAPGGKSKPPRVEPTRGAPTHSKSYSSGPPAALSAVRHPPRRGSVQTPGAKALILCGLGHRPEGRCSHPARCSHPTGGRPKHGYPPTSTPAPSTTVAVERKGTADWEGCATRQARRSKPPRAEATRGAPTQSKPFSGGPRGY
jgi:hypothetical protein